MKDYNLDASQADSLSSLLGVGRDPSSDWDESDYPLMLAHLLDTRIATLRQEMGGAAGGAGAEAPDSAATVRDLITGRASSAASCTLLKDYAKTASRDNGGVMSKTVATVIYYVAIAAALKHGNNRITTLDDARLKHGLQQCLRLGWVGAEARTVLQEALNTLPR